MASLDTSCLVRWFLGDIPQQCAQVEALVTSGRSLYVDDAAIIETIFVLEKGSHLSRPTIQAFFIAAMARPIQLNRTLWAAVLDVWTTHPKLSVIDVYLAQKACNLHEEPLYIFDTKMVNQLATCSLLGGGKIPHYGAKSRHEG